MAKKKQSDEVKLKFIKRSDAEGKDITPEQISLGYGDWAGTFVRASEPFAVSATDAERMLASGHFEVVR